MSHVRFAQSADIPALVELGRYMHVQSRYAWMQFDASRLWTSLEAAADNKQHCLIVASQDEMPGASLAGALWARAQGLPFSNNFVAHIDYLYVMPNWRGTPMAMKMMSGFRRWANNRQVAEILISNAFGSEETYSAKLLDRLGLKMAGSVHSMWMDRQ